MVKFALTYTNAWDETTTDIMTYDHGDFVFDDGSRLALDEVLDSQFISLTRVDED